MGCGASSKRTNGKYNAPDLEASGYSEKTVSSPYSECNGNALEDEVKWLRLKLAQEKQEKEWMMPRGDRQASSSSSSKASKVKQDEEEIMWLRRMFDAEKSEKAWLMAHIDSMDAQLKLRSEECASLRASLGARSEQPQRPESPVSKPGPVAESLKSPSSEQGPLSPGTTMTMSLKERRGLKLGVDTGKAPPAVSTGQAPSVPAGASPTALPLTLPGSLEPARSTSDPLALVGQLKQSRNNSLLYVEPMSPLLARRQSSSKNGVRPKEVTLSSPLSASSPVLSTSPPASSPAKSMPLSVDAFKASTLEEAPCSPKRKRRTSTFPSEEDRKSSLETVKEDETAKVWPEEMLAQG